MKNHLFALIWCVLLLSSCQNSKLENQSNSETKEIEGFIVDYYSTMSQRNWSAYRDFFSEKAILTTIWQDSTEANPNIFTNSISEFISQTKNGPDSQPIFEERPLNTNIEVRDNLANVWVNYEAKFGTQDNLKEWKGLDLFSLLKFNDRWHIISITYLSKD